MPDRTNPPATSTTQGILRPDEFARYVDLARWPAPDPLGRWVEYLWGVRWALPPGSSYASQVVPHPAVNLTVEHATHPRAGLAPRDAVVTGVVTRLFETTSAGDGAVIGIKLRPGGLAALTGAAARSWTDRDVPIDEVLPAAVAAAVRGVDPARCHDSGPDTLVEALLPLADAAPADPTYDRLLAVVADLLADRTLVTVADVEARHDVAGRTLQRWFAHYVGVGPKWVLARYRMHDVVAALDAGWDGSLADLAARSGWYDQSHFTRDFRALVGVTPRDYLTRAGRTPRDANLAARSAVADPPTAPAT